MPTRKPSKLRSPQRAVGIARISKARSDETSTTTQTERIQGWCASKGVDLAKVIVVPGRSAYKTEALTRADVVEALHLIRAGAADVLVVWRIDRVARNARDLLNLIHEIEKLGGSFVSVSEDFNSDGPWSKLVMTILGAIAEMESAIKSERVQVWQEYRRANQAVPTGPRPYGYRRTKNELHIDQAEATVIRKVTADILAGGSVRSAAAAINAAGGRSDGRPLTHRGLIRILTSPTIAALRPVEGTIVEWFEGGQKGALVACGGWEPILDRATWESLHHLLLDPARRTNHSTGRRWLLSGLAECGKCGAPMKVKTHPAGPRYTCGAADHLSIPATDTEQIVEAMILSSLDPKAWRRLRARGTQRVDTAALEAELAELAHRRTLDVREGGITAAEWEILREDIVHRLTDATAEPVALPDITDPRKEWPGLDIEARRLIVAAFLPRIVIGPATPGARFDATRVIIPVAPAEVQDQEPAA